MLNVFIIAVAIISAVAEDHVLTPEERRQITNKVNSAGTTWTAESFTDQMYEPESPTFVDIILSTRYRKKVSAFLEEQRFDRTGEVPMNFDARDKWPECPSIRHIYHQGKCGACWAISAVSAFTDRICIKSQGTMKALRSVQQVLSCSSKKFGLGDGCDGGFTMLAMKYLASDGVVTGGDYTGEEFTNKDGCQPWLVQPCTFSQHNKQIFSCDHIDNKPAAACRRYCYNPEYTTTSYKNDIIKAKKVINGYRSILDVQREIFSNGPIVTWFYGYEDFILYKSGVYQHIAGEQLVVHSVRVLGWGVEKHVPYWLAANSQDEYWGDKGFFKFIKGYNHLGFEENFAAALVEDL